MFSCECKIFSRWCRFWLLKAWNGCWQRLGLIRDWSELAMGNAARNRAEGLFRTLFLALFLLYKIQPHSVRMRSQVSSLGFMYIVHNGFEYLNATHNSTLVLIIMVMLLEKFNRFSFVNHTMVDACPSVWMIIYDCRVSFVCF